MTFVELAQRLERFENSLDPADSKAMRDKGVVFRRGTAQAPGGGASPMGWEEVLDDNGQPVMSPLIVQIWETIKQLDKTYESPARKAYRIAHPELAWFGLVRALGKTPDAANVFWFPPPASGPAAPGGDVLPYSRQGREQPLATPAG